MTRAHARFATLALALLAAAPSLAAPPRGGAGRRKPMTQQVHAAPAHVLSDSQQAELAAELTRIHGAEQRPRIERGLRQVAALWQPTDGDAAAFMAFAREQFVSDPKKLDATFERLEYSLEQIDGYLDDIARELGTPTELDRGPLLPTDPLLAALDLSAHAVEDLFRGRVAFVALLNFSATTLKERLDAGPKWSRHQWAEARLTSRFERRVPAEVQQEIARSLAAADLYISEYNLWMHHVLGEHGERQFPSGLRLISHWNLRDELKAAYADPNGAPRQRTIVKLMERIVTQAIPQAVIDNPRLDWNPFSNQVTPAPEGEIEKNAPAARKMPASLAAPEPDTRYARLLANFLAARKADPYTPTTPTAIARSFEGGREIPEERVKAMLEEVLSSKRVAEVAARIQARLGRPLEPQDLWYAGFQSRAEHPERDLDALCRKRYPSADAFAADIPRILEQLGFSRERAAYLAKHIVVDPSRGAGHARQSQRRGDLPHLRTRVEKEGMNYKGYNIAVHELGHNVEQVFSLYDVDHNLLRGVPNNAFTEALAFVFQAKDLELLGLAKPTPESERLRVLNDFWAVFEIGGVALVDIGVWHWMYEHPDAKPAELRDATIKLARETWNRYYAPLLGGKDSVLLGIYSHMISYPLYLVDYPIGHLIAFQIEEQVRRKGEAGALGQEFERMARQGNLTPDLWMIGATGAPVGAGPLLRATEAALAKP